MNTQRKDSKAVIPNIKALELSVVKATQINNKILLELPPRNASNSDCPEIVAPRLLHPNHWATLPTPIDSASTGGCIVFPNARPGGLNLF
jgi:hypothetical protein